MALRPSRALAPRHARLYQARVAGASWWSRGARSRTSTAPIPSAGTCSDSKADGWLALLPAGACRREVRRAVHRPRDHHRGSARHGSRQGAGARGDRARRRLWPGLPIRIGAQAHLERFYRAFGFVTCFGALLTRTASPHRDGAQPAAGGAARSARAMTERDPMSRQLTGKAAVVTGSTSGIGRGIAECFAREGAHVMLNGFGEGARDRGAARRTREAVRRARRSTTAPTWRSPPRSRRS